MDVTSNNTLLIQIQREATRQDSLLDSFFTNNQSLVSSLNNIPGVSTANEHDAIIADISLRAQFNKSAPRKIFQWSKALWTDIKCETNDFADHFLKTAASWSVDQQWESIECHLTDMVTKFVPSKMSKSRENQPWINTSLKRKCRKQ